MRWKGLLVNPLICARNTVKSVFLAFLILGESLDSLFSQDYEVLRIMKQSGFLLK